jgi:hypothetical protein
MTKCLSIKILQIKDGIKLNIKQYPNYHRSVPISEIRKLEGKKALLIRCGNRIYNVTSNQNIYYNIL